jgi:peroxiredoxin (alkyl hydroperoxide reductase subunit C)
VLSLDEIAPSFRLEGVAGGRVSRVSLEDLRRGWAVIFFYPADFTFVCPTEMKAFQASLSEFRERGCDVVAIGVDDVESHRAWAEELGGIDFPILSDPTREVCGAWGVLSKENDRPWRATFVLAPGGRVAHVTVTPQNVGRSVEETLRIVSALQTGRLCPADWRPGQPSFPLTPDPVRS